MGTSASQIITRLSSSSTKDFDTMENSDVDFCIPEDLLLVILSFVPAYDLLKNGRLVCQQWKDLIDAHALWKIKCDREGKVIPPCKFKELPSNYYRQICLHNPYGRNLIKNPCGTETFMKWEFVSNGDSFVIEDPPVGADPVPKEIGTQSCFSTSFHTSIKRQMISLLKEGVSKEVLDSGISKINVSEWYASRFDCGSIYKLEVMLLDVTLEVVDEFTFEYREEQWAGRAWSQIRHTFKDTSNARYVLFQHTGQDTQFWAGSYGSKMTGACLKFSFN